MRIELPNANHVGGNLMFGKDDLMYISIGDGALAYDLNDDVAVCATEAIFLPSPPFPPVIPGVDPGSANFVDECIQYAVDNELLIFIISGNPTLSELFGVDTTEQLTDPKIKGNGQDTSIIFGNILRIDVNGNNSVNGQYGIPADNPNVSLNGAQAGCDDDGFCDEIYAFGFRNPFKGSIDRDTGVIFAADVGQDAREEVDIVESGRNYGWRIKEGDLCVTLSEDLVNTWKFSPFSLTDVLGVNLLSQIVREEGLFNLPTVAPCTLPTPGLTDPVATYERGGVFGRSVTGGYVYRGQEIAYLKGHYVFGDFTDGFPGTGKLLRLADTNLTSADQRSDIEQIEVVNQPFNPAVNSGFNVSAFAEDAAGELYVLHATLFVPGTGTVSKIVKSINHCHVPDNDPDKATVINISVNAVNSHFANHPLDCTNIQEDCSCLEE